jgi:hypothetical protein
LSVGTVPTQPGVFQYFLIFLGILEAVGLTVAAQFPVELREVTAYLRHLLAVVPWG